MQPQSYTSPLSPVPMNFQAETNSTISKGKRKRFEQPKKVFMLFLSFLLLTQQLCLCSRPALKFKFSARCLW